MDMHFNLGACRVDELSRGADDSSTSACEERSKSLHGRFKSTGQIEWFTTQGSINMHCMPNHLPIAIVSSTRLIDLRSEIAAMKG